jgi:hypothetical protein
LLAQPVVRSASRFIWHLRLGTSPGGPWLARSQERRSWRWPFKSVASLALWSEAGRDRSALLGEVQGVLRRKGVEAELDDGWRDWDLEFSAGGWWRVQASTMTEYHAAGKTLTRVRLASRATHACLLLYVITGLSAAATVFVAGLNPVWALGVLFVWCVVFESRHHEAISLAHAVVQEAAGACAMVSTRSGAGPSRP